MRGKHNKLGEGERKVRLGQDSLPNRETTRIQKVAETSNVVLPSPHLVCLCFLRGIRTDEIATIIANVNAAYVFFLL